jgi:hypothetical protein
VTDPPPHPALRSLISIIQSLAALKSAAATGEMSATRWFAKTAAVSVPLELADPQRAPPSRLMIT